MKGGDDGRDAQAVFGPEHPADRVSQYLDEALLAVVTGTEILQAEPEGAYLVTIHQAGAGRMECRVSMVYPKGKGEPSMQSKSFLTSAAIAALKKVSAVQGPWKVQDMCNCEVCNERRQSRGFEPSGNPASWGCKGGDC